MIPMLRRGAAYDRMSASAPADWLRCSHSDGWDSTRPPPGRGCCSAFSLPGGDQFRSTWWRMGSWPEPQRRSSETSDALAGPWALRGAARPPPSPRLALLSPSVQRAVSPGSTAPYLSTYMWDYSRLRTPPPLPPPPPPPASLGGPPLRLVNAIRLSELSGGGNLHRCAALGPDCVRLCCARAYRLPRYVSWDPCRQAHVLGMRPAPAACRLLQAR